MRPISNWTSTPVSCDKINSEEIAFGFRRNQLERSPDNWMDLLGARIGKCVRYSETASWRNIIISMNARFILIWMLRFKLLWNIVRADYFLFTTTPGYLLWWIWVGSHWDESLQSLQTWRTLRILAMWFSPLLIVSQESKQMRDWFRRLNSRGRSSLRMYTSVIPHALKSAFSRYVLFDHHNGSGVNVCFRTNSNLHLSVDRPVS